MHNFIFCFDILPPNRCLSSPLNSCRRDILMEFLSTLSTREPVGFSSSLWAALEPSPHPPPLLSEWKVEKVVAYKLAVGRQHLKEVTDIVFFSHMVLRPWGDFSPCLLLHWE